MRELTTLPSSDAAQTLADYLLTLRIETKVERQPNGWAVWVRDEDQVPRARQELEDFNRNPDDPRYSAASREAGALRRQKASVEKAYHRRQDRFNRRMSNAGAAGPVTIALIVASALVSLLSEGGHSGSELVQALSIAPYKLVPVYRDSSALPSSDDEVPIGWTVQSPGLEPILHGEIWRLVTPIFIHFTILHLVFNMSWVYGLGGAIERQRGPVRYVALVLFVAVLSNLCQYFLGRPDWGGSVSVPDHVPAFGGMSGVVYGLFGYVWMKARFQPELGLTISPRSVTILMIWLFFCTTPWIRILIGSGVANVAHVSGLLVGMLVGYAPVLWRSFRSE
jgi:GlpG protein